MAQNETPRKSQEETKETQKMTDEKEKPKGEVLVDLVERLLHINYLILEVVDARLTVLEDECSKKEGN